MLGALSGRWRDRSQQAIDPDVPPDPELRLRILSDVVGSLSGAWRGRADRISRSEFAAALRAHPEHARAAVEAEARWYAWHSLRVSDGAHPSPLADPLTWEYMFDGLLAHDLAEENESYVKLVHPVLAEYCAAYFAARREQVDRMQGRGITPVV